MGALFPHFCDFRISSRPGIGIPRPALCRSPWETKISFSSAEISKSFWQEEGLTTALLLALFLPLALVLNGVKKRLLKNVCAQKDNEKSGSCTSRRRTSAFQPQLQGSGAIQTSLKGSGAFQLQGSGAFQTPINGSGAFLTLLKGSGTFQTPLKGCGTIQPQLQGSSRCGDPMPGNSPQGNEGQKGKKGEIPTWVTD